MRISKVRPSLPERETGRVGRPVWLRADGTALRLEQERLSADWIAAELGRWLVPVRA